LLLAQRIGTDGNYVAEVLPAILVLAAGMALAVAPLTSTVLSSVDPRHAGTASGLNSAVARTGGLIATALLGAVLAAKGEALVGAFHTTLLVAAVVSALAGLTAWLTVAGPEPHERTAAEA
jgi:predicted MFS family arabinose efflux permease